MIRAEDAMKEGAPKVYPEGNIEPKDKRGDLAKTEEALSKGEVKIEAEYRTPIIHHSSLETHGNMVDYRGDSAIVYASTQGTFTIPGDAAKELNLPETGVSIVETSQGAGEADAHSPGRVSAGWKSFRFMAEVQSGRQPRRDVSRSSRHSISTRRTGRWFTGAPTLYLRSRQFL